MLKNKKFSKSKNKRQNVKTANMRWINLVIYSFIFVLVLSGEMQGAAQESKSGADIQIENTFLRVQIQPKKNTFQLFSKECKKTVVKEGTFVHPIKSASTVSARPQSSAPASPAVCASTFSSKYTCS